MRLTVSPGPIVQKKIWIFSGNIFGVIWADCSKKFGSFQVIFLELCSVEI